MKTDKTQKKRGNLLQEIKKNAFRAIITNFMCNFAAENRNSYYILWYIIYLKG